MAKQLMMYDNIQPLSQKHAQWSVMVEDYGFTEGLNSVPLLATEIPMAAMEFPVIFSATAIEGEYVPLAVMGLKEGQNLFLGADKKFTTGYIPAFIRRYPFVLGGSEGSDVMAICIDEDSSALVKDGSKGTRIFTETGEQTDFLKEVGEFLKDYQYRGELTRVFTKRLHELGLLEPMSASITLNTKEPTSLNISGFFVINRDKLKALSDADVLELFKKDGVELVYAHLQSLSNFNRLIDIMTKQLNA